METTINDRLKHLRKTLNYRQGEFAQMLDIKQGSYSDIERGRNGVSPNVQRILEEKFNVNLEWLRTGMGPMYMAHTPRVADRLKDVANHYRISVAEMVSRLDVDQITQHKLTNMINDGKDPTPDVINIVCKAFTDVSRRYLITGLGNMLDKGVASISYVPELDEVALLKEQLDLYRRMVAMLEEQNKQLKKGMENL